MTQPTPTLSYVQALQDIARIYVAQARGIMPHEGEKGRIVEEITKNAVEKVLPRRFSLSTGILISSEGAISSQTDIVIYDHFHNTPLLSEFSAHVFPVEIVYATIEVKTSVDWEKIQKALVDIRKIRDISANKQYVVPEWEDLGNGTKRVMPVRVRSGTAPRTYIVAYDSSALTADLDDLRDRLVQECQAAKAHVHGLCLVDRDALFSQRIKQKGQAASDVPQISCYAVDGFYYFLLSLLKHQQNFAMATADPAVYFGGDGSPSVFDGLD